MEEEQDLLLTPGWRVWIRHQEHPDPFRTCVYRNETEDGYICSCSESNRCTGFPQHVQTTGSRKQDLRRPPAIPLGGGVTAYRNERFEKHGSKRTIETDGRVQRWSSSMHVGTYMSVSTVKDLSIVAVGFGGAPPSLLPNFQF